MGDPSNHCISDDIEQVIHDLLHYEGTILELGSGYGTGRLIKHYKVISIEHDERFLGWFDSTYIHAPIEPYAKRCHIFPKDTGWYNREVLSKKLPRLNYDLILVDGPPNAIGRGGFYKWRNLFNLEVPILIDDIHRSREFLMIRKLSLQLRRPFMVYAWSDRHFGVIV